MNYDLTIKEERRKFLRRANYLMRRQRDNVALTDESKRSLNQNAYLHVLCRILAQDIGTSEYYAKQVYFKRLANSELFIRVTKDKVTGKMIKVIRSTSELTIPEMAKAIDNFHSWSREQGYELPEASLTEEGELVFKSEEDKKAFHQAQIMTSKKE